MPIIQILVALIVVGVLLWLVNSFIPMAGSIITSVTAKLNRATCRMVNVVVHDAFPLNS